MNDAHHRAESSEAQGKNGMERMDASKCGAEWTDAQLSAESNDAQRVQNANLDDSLEKSVESKSKANKKNMKTRNNTHLSTDTSNVVKNLHENKKINDPNNKSENIRLRGGGTTNHNKNSSDSESCDGIISDTGDDLVDTSENSKNGDNQCSDISN